MRAVAGRRVLTAGPDQVTTVRPLATGEPGFLIEGRITATEAGEWTARAILAAMFGVLFIPWEPLMIEVTGGPDPARVPLGVGLLMLAAICAACVGIVFVFVWLLVTAGLVRK